ncbi:MAG: protein-glutamate O-methyltransferase CheR [Alphaproteobacteria bacterium]|nr:protein-glutamate O-methyltransferase CheR [Alphaproteobacteria bacterium]
MKPADFEFLQTMLRQRSGLVLTPDKTHLLESRLTPVARRHGLERLDDLVERLRAARTEELAREVTEAMTTNESSFFRDSKPFDSFRKEILPALLAARAQRKQLRIWCAAASTGQEPYTLAMILKEEQAKLAGWRTEIVATDLSTEVLEKAKAGIYSQFEVQRGLPVQMLVKYFTQTGEMWQIAAPLRAMVSYRAFNLLGDPGLLGRFDVVFCRNVLIYFDQPTKAQVLHRIGKQLAPDGYLVLGVAETVLGVTEAFKPVAGQRGFYGPAKAAAA